MSPWAAHFASGNVLFSGIALLVIAAATAWQPARTPPCRIRRLSILIAALLIAASATPLPRLFYAAWAAPLFALLLLDRESEQPRLRKSRRAAVVASLLLSLFVAGWEVVTLFPTQPPGGGFETVYVVGNSVSAGMGDPADAVWPAIMGRLNHVHVVNLAREGATTRSALRQAEQIDELECLVIIEIGGNDMLSGQSSRQFDENLTQLLEALAAPGRRIVLMELPLPPLFNDYGRVQRRRAREYGAAMISKRVFVDVLSTRGATVDGVHLSPSGHRLMAEQVWDHVESLIVD